jgi:primosomal protein N' (replication factor Y)
MIGSTIPHWAISLAVLAAHVRAQGRRTLIVVPTAKDVNRLREALLALDLVEGPSSAEHAGFVALSYELSPAQRYGNYLLAAFGKTDIVIGTRAAAFAPLPDLGLVVCWEDADASHQDLHAPYPHTREVLALRSEESGCALLLGSNGRSLQAQALLMSGWAGEIAAPREVLRVRAPHIVEFGEYEIAADSGGKHGRLPERVWREIRKALTQGTVLIQVPRGGYLPTVACGRCREAARCMECHGPLGTDSAGAAPTQPESRGCR